MTNHKTGTREQWLASRLELLNAEKELIRQSDELARGLTERLPPLRYRLRATVHAVHPVSPGFPVPRLRCYGVSHSPQTILLARLLTKPDWRVTEPLLPDKPKSVPHIRYCRAMKRGPRLNGRSARVMPNGTDVSSAGRIVARRWSKLGRLNGRLMSKDQSLENQNAVDRLSFVPRAARPNETVTENRP